MPEARRVTHKEALHALATVRHYLEQNLTEYNEYYAVADKIEKNASQNRKNPKIASSGKLQTFLNNKSIIMCALIVLRC